jgi:hypothetical protein
MNIMVLTVNYFCIWKHYKSSTKSEVFMAVHIYIVVFKFMTYSLIDLWLPVFQRCLLHKQYTMFYHYPDQNLKVAAII